MVRPTPVGHDGDMNETHHAPPDVGPEPDAGFDPHRLRTITDMRRSRDDRYLGGVCGGAARYLDIDPVVVRIIIAVLTIVGFAGAILYAAAWFLLPSEDAERSVAADWFNLDKNEEQVRVAGLIGAAVLAGVAVVGDNGYAWWGAPWVVLPLAGGYYLFVVRPRRRTGGTPDYPTTSDAPSTHEKPARPPRSRALTVLTLSVAAIAVAVLRLYADLREPVPWPAYVAVALAVVGAGLVVGTFFGHGGPLIAIGVLLAVVLAASAVVPSPRIGQQQQTPPLASDVERTYSHGLGQLELDLTEVSDPEALLGRRVELESGAGQTMVIVPADLNVRVEASVAAGQVRFPERTYDGTELRSVLPADDPGPALTLDLSQRFGTVEVVRR
jgi:phage shock protein PspC (stress-responsive transcriptional regulator)